MAVGFFEGDAGLIQFTDEKVKDPRILRLAAKIRYVIDPNNEYPDNYSGHMKVTFRDGAVKEMRQPHMRGGVREPLTRDELMGKFRSNVAYGGWPADLGERLLEFCIDVGGKPDLSDLKAFRV